MLRTAGGNAGRRTALRRRSLGGREGRHGGGGRRSGGGDPVFGEDGAGRGGSRPRSGGRRRRTGGVAGARVLADFGSPAAVENPVGQRTGGATEAADG
jgi:hypothetical protein